MKHLFLTLLLAIGVQLDVIGAEKQDPKLVIFEVHNGYFVSNKFEPDAVVSFMVITDQASFDAAFGVGHVMNDKSKRLPAKAFESKMVIAAVKRGSAVYTYDVKAVANDAGVLTIRYTTSAKESPTAQFACPLIVSIPIGTYTAVQFSEDEKIVKKIELAPEHPKDPADPKPVIPGVVADGFTIECQKTADSVALSLEDDKTVLTVNSTTGIGEATITRKGEHWPETVILRLRLGGLEFLSIGASDTELCASVLSHSGNPTLLHRLVQGKEGPKIAKGDPCWLEIRVVDAKGAVVKGLPPAGGVFELTIPKAMLTDHNDSIAVGWIDFYRK